MWAFFPVSCSVNYNDYNCVFILFGTLHEGRGREVREETGVWLPGTLAPGSAGLGPALSLAAPWASPLLQGRVHGAAWSGRDPWSLEKADSRTCTSARRLYCVGFHMKNERILGRLFSSTHALESGMSCSFPRSAVVNSQPQAWREKAGTRQDRAPLLGGSGEGSLPAYPALGDSLPTSLPWCSLKVPTSLPSSYPSARPLCLHVGSVSGRHCLHRGSAHPGVTPCGQIASAGPCFHMQPISSSCILWTQLFFLPLLSCPHQFGE